MKNYLNFETEIKNLETELDNLKDPYNQSGLSEVDTKKILQTQNELDEKLKEIADKALNEEKDLLHKIRSYVADKAGEKCTSCFAIHSTDYEQNYIYVSHHASYVQEQNIDS